MLTVPDVFERRCLRARTLLSARPGIPVPGPPPAAQGPPRHLDLVNLQANASLRTRFPRCLPCSASTETGIELGVGSLARAGNTPEPVEVATGAHAQHAAQLATGEVGLVRLHKFEDVVNVRLLLPANQAVAFAKISRSV